MRSNCVFRGLLTTADVAAAWANLESDLRSSRLVRTHTSYSERI